MYENISSSIKRHSTNDAIIFCDENQQLQTLKYKDVEDLSTVFYENLKYISEDSICFGLLMRHNVLIPSLIVSLQRLNCSFIFLDENQTNRIESSKLLSKIGVKYIITYDIKCCIPGIKFLFAIIIESNKICDIYVNSNNNQIHTDINYIVQTSGTTDIRKVVRVEHNCIESNIICLRNRLKINSEDVIYFGTSLTFDPSMIELYLGLISGAKLLIIDEKIRTNPSRLYKLLFQIDPVKVTFLQMCPSSFLQWSLSEIEDIFQNSSLKSLLLGGEDFPQILSEIKRSETLKLYNVYGITELSCWAFLAEITEGQEINLGSVLDDTLFEIKGEDFEDITEGEGELFVGSSYRICYLDDEKSNTIKKPVMRKTGDRVSIRGNQISYKGRCNDVIKRFGHRINLQFIENTILTTTGLKSVCIWLVKGYKLVLYVVINRTDEEIEFKIKDKLRVKILHLLPKECMPDHIELISELPLTRNGKIDKAKLELQANSILKQICANESLVDVFNSIWFRFFGNDPKNMGRTFYDMGGTSIMRIQSIEEIKRIYTGPTIMFDYIFANKYSDACQFLRDMQNKSKRKLIDTDIDRNKIIKFNNTINLELNWSYNLEACVDSTAVVLSMKRFVAIGSFSNIFAILNVDTGEEILKVILPNAIESSCLVSSCETYIYIGCFDSKLYCVEVDTANIIWECVTDDRIKNKPVLLKKDTILFGSYDKHIYCINSNTGETIWKLNVNAPVTADILLHKEIIIAVTIKGCCFCFNHIPVIVWQVDLGRPVFGSPTKLNDKFLIPDVLGTIHCLDFHGKKLWYFDLNENIYSSILLLQNYLVFGTHNSAIYFLEDLSGDFALKPVLKHKLNVDSAVSSAVASLIWNNETYVVVASVSGYVYLINFDDFTISSKIKLDGEIFSSVVVFEDKIFVGCRDNNLICVKVQR